jgi:hypothetical protein
LDNLLDLVLCNDANCIIDTQVTSPFSTSDHNTVQFKITNTSSQSFFDKDFTLYDFNHADWSQIQSYLSTIDFDTLLTSDETIDAKFESFYAILFNCIDLYVPQRKVNKVKRARSTNYPPGIRKLQRKKATAWRLYKAFHTPESLSSYKKIALHCRSAVQAFIAKRESSLIDNGNIGSFFRYANNKFSSKSSVPILKDESGAFIHDSVDKANILQSVFTGKFITDNGVIPNKCTNNSLENKLNDIVFTPVLIERVLKKLKVKTKGGPDGVPPIFLKQCSALLCKPLAILFSSSFNCGYLPEDWLRSYITPLFKKGVTSDPNNYRPVALTATLCKVMESVIKDQLLQYLTSKGLISKKQHAFIKNHSTATNLLECTHDWFVSLNSRHSTDIVYIDFSRAFDSIVFKKLLCKLESYGINGKLLAWIEAFLNNRSQCVVIDHCFSSVSSVLSGVPQGSVLGPILFLIFINDLESICCGESNIMLFADDAKLYSRIDIDQPSVSLQHSLDRLSHWAESWQLAINISKCCVLSTCSNKAVSCNSYYLDRNLIPSTSYILDLGITITSDLSFHTHINNIVAKALQRNSTFFRGFVSRNLNLCRKAFVTYIRPLLEYNSIVWNPIHIYLIDLVESVQRKFTKRILLLSGLSYAERLARLGLESLELRRLRFDLINYFKVLNNVSPITPCDHFLIHQPLPSSRSSMPYLQKPLRSNSKLSSSFFYRQVDAWNYLPCALKSSSSLTSFKSALKKVNLSLFLKGNSLK